MSEVDHAQPHEPRTLRFACSCASALPVAADPWVAVAKQGKLADGAKELILNALHVRPRSVTQLAQLLDLSSPAVHRHVVEMLASELIREIPIQTAQRRSPTERHYQPALPIVLAEFLNKANPDHWPLAELKAQMKMHLDLTLKEASDRLSGDFAADIKDYDAVHDHILKMADLLSSGIIAQFPDKFG